MSGNETAHSIFKLNPSMTVGEAKQLFDQLKLNAMPVVDNGIFQGLLFLEVIVEAEADKTLSSVAFLLKDISLKKDFTFFDWYKLCSKHNLISIPLVSSKKNKYKGNITIKDIFDIYKDSSLTVELSTILVLQKNSEEFVYSEVFQIIEAHGAKVLATFIGNSNQEKTEIILKILHTGLNELLQSFRRYDFEIISYHDEDLHHETLKDNSEYLSKYLTV